MIRPSAFEIGQTLGCLDRDWSMRCLGHIFVNAHFRGHAGAAGNMLACNKRLFCIISGLSGCVGNVPKWSSRRAAALLFVFVLRISSSIMNKGSPNILNVPIVALAAVCNSLWTRLMHIWMSP